MFVNISCAQRKPGLNKPSLHTCRQTRQMFHHCVQSTEYMRLSFHIASIRPTVFTIRFLTSFNLCYRCLLENVDFITILLFIVIILFWAILRLFPTVYIKFLRFYQVYCGWRFGRFSVASWPRWIILLLEQVLISHALISSQVC